MPVHMTGYNIVWVYKFLLNIFNSNSPGFWIRIRKITKVLSFCAFHQASAIKDFFFVKPNNNIVW